MRLSEPRTAAGAVAALRAGAGVVMLTRPTWTRLLGVDRATAERTSWVSFMLGGREIALGLGALLALRADAAEPGTGGVRRWLLAGVAADVSDCSGAVRALLRRDTPRVSGAAIALTAALAAAAGVRGALGR